MEQDYKMFPPKISRSKDMAIQRQTLDTPLT